MKDVADLTWQIARLRPWVTAFIASGEHKGLARAVRAVVPSATTSIATIERIIDSQYDEPGEHANACRDLLARYGLVPNQVGAGHGFFHHLRSLADAEDLLMRLEHRRDRATQHVEARRQAFGAALRAAANRVVDADALEESVVGGSPPLANLPAARAGTEAQPT